MSERFSTPVEAVLREAGWYPGRRLSDDEITAMHRGFATGRGRFGGQLDGAYLADAVLREFGGLVIAGPGPGLEINPRPFAIDPSLAARYTETLIDVERAMRVILYPLGVEGMDEAVLAITDLGKIISVDPTGEWLLGDNFDEALDLLITGRHPRPVQPSDGRTPPPWQPPPEQDRSLGAPKGYGGLKRPLAAVFFLPWTSLNLYYTWLPQTLLRIGVTPLSSPVIPGNFYIDDWGGVACEVMVLDLDLATVLVLAFEQTWALDQFYDTYTDDATPPDAVPLVKAFRNACANLASDLYTAFLHTRLEQDLLGFIAELEDDVFNAHLLLYQGFTMLYLSEGYDPEIGEILAVRPRDTLPVPGGRIIFANTGKRRWQ